MTGPCEPVHLLLQAELDGELDAAGAAGLEAHLAGCKACRSLREELGSLSSRLRAIPRHAVPAELQRSAAALVLRGRPRWRRPGWGHGASFVAGLAVAACVGLAVLPADPGIGQDLVDAHIRALQPGHLLDVPSTDQHTVKPWFNGRIGLAPDVQDLAAEGFPLLGGRLDYVGRNPAAVLVYGRDRHVIDVFVQGNGAAGSLQVVRGFNVVSWTGHGARYSAVSDLNARDLSAFVALMKGEAGTNKERN